MLLNDSLYIKDEGWKLLMCVPAIATVGVILARICFQNINHRPNEKVYMNPRGRFSFEYFEGI